jgi:hypothetical protein
MNGMLEVENSAFGMRRSEFKRPHQRWSKLNIENAAPAPASPTRSQPLSTPRNSPQRVKYSPAAEARTMRLGLKDLELPLKELSSHSNHSPSRPGKPKATHDYRVKRVFNPPPVQMMEARYLGKVYRFARPVRSFENHYAATDIQRVVRGGMQRLRYKIQRLEHWLDTSRDRTKQELAAIRRDTELRKAAIRAELDASAEKSRLRSAEAEVAAGERQKLIDYLRLENRRLREDNNKIATAIQSLNHENERIFDANSSSDDSIGSLAMHAKTIQKTHAKLQQVIPQYKAAIQEMEAAVRLRDMHLETERKLRGLYLNWGSEVQELFEGTMGEDELSDDVVRMCLEMEEQELKNFGVRCFNYESSYGRSGDAADDDSLDRMKARYDVPDPSEHAGIDEEIDAYTLHTLR